MTRDEWDRLSLGQRNVLILNAIYDWDGSPYSFHDGQLWFRETQATFTHPNDISHLAEMELIHRGLRDKYIHSLTTVLIGDNTPDCNDLWAFVTATSSERCLAAYNCLEGLK